MKRLLRIRYCLSFALCLYFFPSPAQQVFKTTTGNVIGYLEYLPPDYHKNSDDYPVVIFLHGRGEKGPDSKDPKTLSSGEKSLTRFGPPHYVKKGTQFPFILISPQLKSVFGDWPLWYIMEVIEHVKRTLRIDEQRIYLTGLSLGGGGVWTAAESHPGIFAAIAPVCGSRNAPSKAKLIADADLPVWAFHGDKDELIPFARTIQMVEAINSFHPDPRAKYTLYKGVKHNAWDRAYSPDHSEHNPNVYEWMLSHTLDKNYGNQEIANETPIVKAGGDRVIESTQRRLEIDASASDPDGTIVRYEWSKHSGRHVRMDGVNKARLILSDLRKGIYEFRITVTDDKGSRASDLVRVIVNDAGEKHLLAFAGPDRYLKLPVSYYTMAGGGTSPDGGITSYEWEQIDGPELKLSDTKTRIMKISDVTTPGKRTFLLTVRDNKGRVGRDHVRIYFDAPVSGRSATGPVEAGADPDNASEALREDAWRNSIVTIFDANGRRVFSGMWNKEKYSEVFAQKGIYIYRIKKADQPVKSGKIFIQ
jgi:hypothetical protein